MGSKIKGAGRHHQHSSFGHGHGHGRGHGRGGLDDDESLWRGPGGRGHGGRGHGGRERPFEYGKLRFIVLQLIGEKPSHGYEIIKAIEDKTEGAYAPSPGVVYPTLALLEDLGYIAAGANDDNRKLYKITATGRKYLGENKAVVEEVGARLSAAASARSQFEAPQIIRALQNLKTALRLKIGDSQLSAAQVQALAAALDAAAADIERI
jgi:DNA-binding PadR family transcriptional regulator